MHGISHLYRQHAVEKQISVGSVNGANGASSSSADSWSNQNSSRNSYEPSTSLQERTLYCTQSSSNSSSSNSNNSNNSALGGVTGSAYSQWQTERHSQPQAVPDAHKSLANHHHQHSNYNNSPLHQANGGGQSGQRSSYDSCYTSGSGISGSLKRTPSSKRSFFERSHSPAIYGVSNDQSIYQHCYWPCFALQHTHIAHFSWNQICA